MHNPGMLGTWPTWPAMRVELVARVGDRLDEEVMGAIARMRWHSCRPVLITVGQLVTMHDELKALFARDAKAKAAAMASVP